MANQPANQPANQSTFEQLLHPIFQHLLLDRAAMERYYNSQDWEAIAHHLTNPQVTYPDYYTAQTFHGITQGYRCIATAIAYDPMTQYTLPPNETWVRQSLIDAIQVRPLRILDLGCGTGSMALMLKQKFPNAEVIGFDLSPYMLAVAADRAAKAVQPLTLRHGNATQTGFHDASFDLVTIGLLLHETPTAVTQAILQETYRILRTGGEVLILDGNQQIRRRAGWLTHILEPPYINDYTNGNLNDWLESAGFGAVQSQDIWLVHQLTRGVKGINQNIQQPRFADLEVATDGAWAAN